MLRGLSPRPRPRLAAALLASLLAAGCAVKTPPDEAGAPEAAPPAAAAKPAAPRDGKYYKDDGPPEVDAVDWRTVADATPEFEPIPAGYNRPYEVFGVKYIPFTDYTRYLKRGTASWYGRRYHGRQTSTGEVYDMYGMTAAHTVLPIPSYARVTRVDDGRSIVVRINDRGPFLNERLIDLSYVAARKLGVVASGTAEVIVEAILPPVPAPAPAARQAEEPAAAPPQATDEPGLYLQLGAYSSAANARDRAEGIALPAGLAHEGLRLRAGADGLHRVLLGPYANRAVAARDRELLARGGLESFLKELP
ncbi:MAG: septal ring lytic transglycosylase RlpA family protein [Betaproteobacteria bacterium AqS2]|uniref:Endolytic peptidoglycan transglycosylase RlpA n=1 Tax=Candidatus Amphirhobacter heronislandensis TaxID=1732024 RepID=A0A930UBA7_9GAMM|nr:septal ring lytic transglycosylase RlpA family protein [Betaproteobacteria bacterium AqS2]